MRTAAVLVLAAASVVLAVHLMDCLLYGLPVGLAPVLLLDQAHFRQLPWQGARPSAWRAWGLPILAILFLGELAHQLGPQSFARSEGLFLALVLVLQVSTLASLLELTVGLVRACRGRPASKPGVWSAVGLCVLIAALVGIRHFLAFFHPHHRLPEWPPDALARPHEDVVVPAADGTLLAGTLFPHAQAVGNVVFWHGHGGNRAHVYRFLPRFQALRLNVLACDFRGHGLSPGRSTRFGAAEVDDVVGAERYLHDRFPDQPSFLVGVSYGASVVIQALPRMPRVRAAWVESGFARLSDMAVHSVGEVPGPVLSAYDNLVWLDCGFHPLAIRPIDSLRDVRVPLMFCHGTEDHYVFFRESVEMHDAYRGPKEHYWVEGAAHNNVSHQGGAEYERQFVGFFTRQLAAPPAPP